MSQEKKKEVLTAPKSLQLQIEKNHTKKPKKPPQFHQTHGSHLQLTETTAPGGTTIDTTQAGGVWSFRFTDLLGVQPAANSGNTDQGLQALNARLKIFRLHTPTL